ncbi:hypothetical protein AGMMS4952_27900 [Spirochaetia bacterium]|nr:hypothetical protein AGMMS4952_27900 [Spirochaetia bacterium]
MQGHIRFRLVPISGITRSPAVAARIMAPFTLAALVLLLVPAVLPAPVPGGSLRANAPAIVPSSRDWTGWKNPLALDAKAFAEMYLAHVEFQRAFSLMSLNAPEKPQAYRHYALAEDGLIDRAGEPVDSDESVNSFEIPPFPLSGLIDFLTAYPYTDPGYGSSGSGGPLPNGLFCLLVVLGLCIVLTFQNRRRPLTLAAYMDKRIAA